MQMLKNLILLHNSSISNSFLKVHHSFNFSSRYAVLDTKISWYLIIFVKDIFELLLSRFVHVGTIFIYKSNRLIIHFDPRMNIFVNDTINNIIYPYFLSLLNNCSIFEQYAIANAVIPMFRIYWTRTQYESPDVMFSNIILTIYYYWPEITTIFPTT